MPRGSTLSEEQKLLIQSRSITPGEAFQRWGIKRSCYWHHIKIGIANGTCLKVEGRRGYGDAQCRVCATTLIASNWYKAAYQKGDYICKNCTYSKKKADRWSDPSSYLYKSIRSRAQRSGIPFDIEPCDIVVPESCPMLGIPLSLGTGKPSDNSPSVDRIVPSLGYVKGNICVISYRANRIKNDASLGELLKITDWMIKNGSSSG